MDLADDPIKEEHDIFLSAELADQLYLLQFPLRPKGRPYPEPCTGKFKPENKILELGYQLAKDEHYDVNAPEKQNISEITLKSSRNPAKATYAVGVTHGGSIYLTAVKGTLVMRPDVNYYNKSSDIVDEDDEGEAEETMETETAVPKGKGKGLTELKVEYSKRRNDENHFGPLTYQQLSSAQNEEPWVNIDICGMDQYSTIQKYEGLETCPLEDTPSTASLEGFITAMHVQATHEYADSAADPDWKVLSSPDYPGRIDSKEWLEKRKLRSH